jgi:hypothetical protein
VSAHVDTEDTGHQGSGERPEVLTYGGDHAASSAKVTLSEVPLVFARPEGKCLVHHVGEPGEHLVDMVRHAPARGWRIARSCVALDVSVVLSHSHEQAPPNL